MQCCAGDSGAARPSKAKAGGGAEAQRRAGEVLYKRGPGAYKQVTNMLLELDASGQLPVIVFHLVRAGCTRRALAVTAWLKACLAQRAGRSYEELLEEQEALQEELRKARSTLEDARGGGKKLAPEKEELLQVRPLRTRRDAMTLHTR